MSPPRRSAGLLSPWLLAGLLAVAGACTNSPPPPPDGPVAEAAPEGPDYFRDVTAESGVDADYRNGEEAGRYAILEALGGGVALFDYDGDGLLDLFVVAGGSFEGQQIRGRPCRLFKNLGNFRFREVTREAGLETLAGGAPGFTAMARRWPTTTATAGPTCW
jgi:hypothetical protein